MPLNGAGSYTPPAPAFPAISGTVVEAAKFNEIITDIAAALSLAYYRDGQAPASSNLSMGGFRLTNTGAPVSSGDAVNLNYLVNYVKSQFALGSVYLGSFATDPTERPDGTALEAGDIYLNISNPDMPYFRGFSGTAWVEGIPGNSATINYTPAGTGAVETTVENVLHRKVYAQDYADPQDAIDAGDIIEFSAGPIPFSSQIVVPDNKEIIVRGVFTPTVNAPAPGTPLFLITGSNVTIKHKHKAGMDGVNTGFSNWAYVSARATGVREDVQIFKGRFRNIGIDNTSSYVIDLSGIQSGGKVIGGDYKNCGVINNVGGGGFAIYSDYCSGLEISGNTIVRCGSSGINSSTGLNNKIFNNTLENITLFSFKAGFGIGITISNDITPTLSSFSVTKNALNVKAMRPGVDFCIPRTVAFPPPQGTIMSVTDNGTYLTITLAEDSPALPVVGEGVQPLDTGTQVIGNSFRFSGDNTMDMNGMARLLVSDNIVEFGSQYMEAGVFAGLAAGIWAGYDPQGPLQSMNNRGVTIKGNKIYNTKGSAIQVFSSNDTVIKDNECYGYNTVNNVDYGGIEVGRLGFNRNVGLTITDNICNSPKGYSILAGNYSRMTVSNNKSRSEKGIILRSPQDCDLKGNNVISTAAGVHCYLVEDPSAANPGASLRVKDNFGYSEGAGGYVFRNTDANFVDIEISDDNDFRSANSTTVIFEDLSVRSGSPSVSGVFGGVRSKPMRFTLAAGSTIKLAQYSSDPGTIGGVIIHGFARRGTAAGEVFRAIFYGSTATTTGRFDSLGAVGAGTFLALGDFTTTTSGGLYVNCNYTNNEADPVSMTLFIESMSRI